MDSQRTARSDPAPSVSDLYRSPFKEAEKSGDNFARGGNGIFGEPMVSGLHECHVLIFFSYVVARKPVSQPR